MQIQMDLKALDVKLAPPGYRAEIRPQSVWGVTQNLCRLCDWRPNCNPNSLPIDKISPEQNCRGYELIGSDGKEYIRADRCDVIFKQIREVQS